MHISITEWGREDENAWAEFSISFLVGFIPINVKDLILSNVNKKQQTALFDTSLDISSL